MRSLGDLVLSRRGSIEPLVPHLGRHITGDDAVQVAQAGQSVAGLGLRVDFPEPVITEVNDCSVIAAQLATEHSNCGYVIIALPQYSPESTLVNIDLIETLLNQIGLIAKLIEKNHLLYEVQMKHYRVCGQSEIALN